MFDDHGLPSPHMSINVISVFSINVILKLILIVILLQNLFTFYFILVFNILFIADQIFFVASLFRYAKYCNFHLHRWYNDVQFFKSIYQFLATPNLKIPMCYNKVLFYYILLLAIDTGNHRLLHHRNYGLLKYFNYLGRNIFLRTRTRDLFIPFPFSRSIFFFFCNNLVGSFTNNRFCRKRYHVWRMTLLRTTATR